MTGYNVRIRESIGKYRGKEHPVDSVGYKLKGLALAEKLGINHAKIIGIFNRIEDINWEVLSNEFVIKPQQGCALNGVFPLKNNNGIYKNLLKHIYMTREEIIMDFKKGEKPIGKHSQNLWIEELLSDPLPCNWEFHSFNGEIGVIEQLYKALTPEIRNFWTTDWEPLGHIFKEPEEVFKKIKIDIGTLAPKNKDKLLEVARILSKAVKYPYVRVDLYDIGDKVFIGELTPHPGTFLSYHFVDWDEYLGNLWDKAIKELSYEKKSI
jgi:hypothetical protein